MSTLTAPRVSSLRDISPEMNEFASKLLKNGGKTYKQDGVSVDPDDLRHRVGPVYAGALLAGASEEEAHAAVSFVHRLTEPEEPNLTSIIDREGCNVGAFVYAAQRLIGFMGGIYSISGGQPNSGAING